MTNAEEYLDQTYQRLARRKTYRKRFVPTNRDLRRIIAQLVQRDAPLIATFFFHALDLIELASAVFFATQRAQQIEVTATTLKRLRESEKKRQKRARKLRPQEEALSVTPAELARFLNGYDRRRGKALLDQQLRFLTKYYPGISVNKKVKLTGRRQDLPLKIAHLEIAHYLEQSYGDHVPLAQRKVWTHRILNASDIGMPTLQTFRKQHARLTKQRLSRSPSRTR